MDSVNYEQTNLFIEGLKGDFVQLTESNKSYSTGRNGRLYSHNGVIAYSSIKGTKEVYKNPAIQSYLGSWSFQDELIIFAKCSLSLLENSQEVSDTINNVGTNPLDFQLPLSVINDDGAEIDYTEYFREVVNTVTETCSINLNSNIQNDPDKVDCVFSLKKDDEGNLYDSLVWAGYLNWSENAKISTYGLFENNFYKRVYFTDHVTPFKVINLKDVNVSTRKGNEFNAFQGTSLLEPLIDEIKNDGQLKAGTVLYVYRLFTENGQSTEFSPGSQSVKILKKDTGVEYEGGDISEITNKSVRIKCNIVDHEKYNEVECVAIEYEALGSPTSIASLGIKQSQAIVYFDHFGNEPEFTTDLNINEILTRKNTWKYASDLHSKGNRLVASGLRNDPLPTEILNMSKDFTLHGWDENGLTHESLINPEPSKYKFIDPLDTSKKIYTEIKVYNSIQIFGSFTITFINKLTGDSYSREFINEINTYKNFTQDIYDWLITLDLTPFPDLKIENTQKKIVFAPINNLNQTDMADYKFEYNTNQVIEDFQEKVEFKDLNVTGTLINGAQSLGFNQGNGVRITFDTTESKILDKATAAYPADGPILKLAAPGAKKVFMKGETYRLGLQIFDNDGFQLFTIPLGDLSIPNIGDQKKFLGSISQLPVILNDEFKNSVVRNNEMFTEGITLKVDVRLSCDIQKHISMYQLVYVERTAENRTILCQGISAPLQRVTPFEHSEFNNIPEPVANKWSLPYYGGPLYDEFGLNQYDTNPYQDDQRADPFKRITVNRSLIYFDAPDLIYNKVSDELVKSGSVQMIARLNPDNDILATFNFLNNGGAQESFPAFSRKIHKEEIENEEERRSAFVNVSVFLEKKNNTTLYPVSDAETLNYGEVLSGSTLNVQQDISNNAITLNSPSWFFSKNGRESALCGTLENGAQWELFNSSNFSPGYKTVFIKTNQNVFTDEFIDQAPTLLPPLAEQSGQLIGVYNTHALVNIKMNNDQSVYGGRSELAYSQNQFIPLGKTIPVLKESNAIQSNIVNGDTYSTLYIRNKNGYNTLDVRNNFKINNSPDCANNDEFFGHRRNGAWCYAAVIESSIEPRWTDKDRFYKTNASLDFLNVWSETINEAYFQENTIRTFIPKPFNFKDDPNLGNIIAVSDTKLTGDFYDKWTSFKTNNFYEVEKDKGVVYNLAKYLNDLYAVQERQTSILQIDENVMVPGSNGEITLQQGNGDGISNHQIISDYGTSIRRAIVEIVSGNKMIKGFSFFDEHRFEFMKISEPLFIDRDLHLKMRDLFKQDPIIDTEGYFDDEYKETNIRVRTKSGQGFVISFNEKFNVFNGFIDYDNRIYMVWNESVYSPLKKTSETILHELNKGEMLRFFDFEAKMKIGIVINPNPNAIKIFKHWAAVMNIDYHINEITLKTSSGQHRTIKGDHYRYQIKEGRHSIPLKNRTDWDDLRGHWCELIVDISSLNDQKIDVFSFINFVRHSYQ